MKEIFKAWIVAGLLMAMTAFSAPVIFYYLDKWRAFWR